MSNATVRVVSTPVGAQDDPVARRPEAPERAVVEDGVEQLGSRIRAARVARGVGVRELSRLVDCSASLISQIERGRANPSVSTLYAISSALAISVDSLFSAAGANDHGEPTARAPFWMSGEMSEEASAGMSGDGPNEPDEASPVPDDRPVAGVTAALAAFRRDATVAGASTVPADRPHAGPGEGTSVVERGEQRRRSVTIHRGERRIIHLERGVRWELLMPTPEHSAEFMEVHYAPGGGSTADDHAIRHQGREYSVILEGVLSVQIGFEQYRLGPGDSMAFDSTIPHRFWNEGSEPVRAIWFVLDRWSVSDA